jgi:hypothetical protein
VWYACTVRTHPNDAGIDRFIVTVYMQLFISEALLDSKCPRDQPYASARMVPHLMYDLYRARGLGEVSVSPL